MFDLHTICLNEESPQAVVVVVILVLSTSLAFFFIFMSAFIAIYVYPKIL